MSRRQLGRFALVLVALALIAGLAAGFAPPLDEVHEYTEHEASVEEIVYDAERNVIWSIDQNLENEVTFVGYDVASGEVIERRTFQDGHALALGPDGVLIADGDTLWRYNVSAEEYEEAFTLSEHVGEMEYDAERGWLWAGGGQLVWAQSIENGTETVRHEAHTDGIETIDVASGYVASGTTFSDEVLVYDIEAEEIVFEPDLAEGTEGVGAVEINDAGQLMIGAGETIPVYDIAAQELVTQAEGQMFGVADIEYYEAQDVIISVGGDNRAKFFDMQEQTQTAVYEHDDTIYVSALDTENELLWIGDGEGQPGTVTAIDIGVEASSDDTTDDTSDADTDDGTDDSGDSDADDSDTDDGTDGTDDSSGDNGSTDDETDGGNGDDGSPGFGIILAAIALIGAGAFHRFGRRRS